MTGKKQCEITGVNEGLYRRAVAEWKRETKPKARMRASTMSFVGQLPPPPTSQYYHCMSKWYQCYMQASYLDSYRRQMASIEQQMTYGEINLAAHLESYAACIGGSPA